MAESLGLLEIVAQMPWNKVFEPVVNLWLIKSGARPGSMIAHYDLDEDKREEQVEYILNMAESFGLKWRQIAEYRYVIGTEETISEFNESVAEGVADVHIGKALGFQCWDHVEYGNHNIDRFAKTITIQYGELKAYVVEVAVASLVEEKELVSHMEEKMRAFKAVLPEEFVVSGEVEFVVAATTRLNKLDDLDYVRQHAGDFYNDLWNWCEGDDVRIAESFYSVIESETEYARFLPYYKYFWSTVICV